MILWDEDDRQAWPPVDYRPVLDTMKEHSAWYSGDAELLEGQYRNGPTNRPSQLQGGLVGAAARMFWGRPRPAGQHRTKLHVPVPADIATVSSDLLFSEAPRVILPDSAGTGPQERVEEIINTPEVHATLLEAAEVSAALTGIYLRMVWDVETADYVMIDAVHPDQAIPEFRWNRLQSVIFFNELETNGQKVLRHLETHEPGRIRHELWVGERQTLGQLVPLTEHPSTAHLAEYVDSDSSIPTGVDKLTATYIPNIRPARRWRNTRFAPLGRSDYEGVEGLFDALDETYSSWVRDIRLAKGRLIVPMGYLDSRGRGQGATFDDDQEIFTELNMLGKDAGEGITAQQFAIRHEEHAATAQNIVRTILRSTGYSAQTFGEDMISAQATATEVQARERTSDRTRDKKARYWASALGPFFRTLLQVDQVVFGGGNGTDEVPEVRFPEAVHQDRLQMAQSLNALRQAELVSIETGVRALNPDWDSETVEEEVARIREERGQFVNDPFQIGRVDDEPDEEEEQEDDGDEE